MEPDPHRSRAPVVDHASRGAPDATTGSDLSRRTPAVGIALTRAGEFPVKMSKARPRLPPPCTPASGAPAPAGRIALPRAGEFPVKMSKARPRLRPPCTRSSGPPSPGGEAMAKYLLLKH